MYLYTKYIFSNKYIKTTEIKNTFKFRSSYKKYKTKKLH